MFTVDTAAIKKSQGFFPWLFLLLCPVMLFLGH
ncbi:MAG: DUF2933 domain-containing protein [Proteobacteria bacterium]|nr:DUF2933 domain-containing protein [Pseudomonadota bacterium]MBU1639324.1 DUF2933 domain-containing protein [Pseudomonadota bacterium]